MTPQHHTTCTARRFPAVFALDPMPPPGYNTRQSPSPLNRRAPPWDTGVALALTRALHHVPRVYESGARQLRLFHCEGGTRSMAPVPEGSGPVRSRIAMQAHGENAGEGVAPWILAGHVR